MKRVATRALASLMPDQGIRSTAVLAIAAVTLALWVCAVTATPEACASLALMAWFSVPGLVLAWRSDRKDDAGMLLAWAAAGLGMTLVTIAIVGILLNSFLPVWVLSVPAALSVLILMFVRPAKEDFRTPRSVGSLHVVCLVVSAMAGLALATPAWLRAGAALDAGVNFQAFFSADFFKHLGITSGFAWGELPPQDLFGAEGKVHYYWLQHVIGGTLLALLPAAFDPVQLLLAIGMWQTTALGALLYLWARRYGAGPVLCVLAVVVGLASLSMDGLASLLLSNAPWLDMQRINMEALDLGNALGYVPSYPAASTLYRLALYIPQHQLCAIFFVAWALLAGHRQDTAAGRWARICLVAAMPATSLLLGVPAVGAAVLFQAMNALCHRDVRKVAPEFFATAIALILPLATEMVVPGATAFGLASSYTATHEPPLVWRLVMLPFHWLTSIGVMLPTGIAGMIMLARRKDMAHGRWIPLFALATACLGYIASQALLAPSRLRIDAELKLSFLLAVSLVPAAAYAADNVPQRFRRSFAVVAITLAVLGLPSVIHDTVWHSCRNQACAGEAGRSTTIPYADHEALTWIRHRSGTKAVFQQSIQTDFIGGGRDVWIPVIGGRAVHSSHRASNASAKESLDEMVKLFEPDDAIMPSARASAHGIHYLYLSQALEGKNYDALRARFRSDTHLELAFQNSGTEIWHVKGTIW